MKLINRTKKWLNEAFTRPNCFIAGVMVGVLTGIFWDIFVEPR